MLRHRVTTPGSLAASICAPQAQRSEMPGRPSALSGVERTLVLGVYLVAAYALNVCLVGSWIPSGGDQGLWFLSVVAFFSFALLSAPFFTRPDDVIAAAPCVGPLTLEHGHPLRRGSEGAGGLKDSRSRIFPLSRSPFQGSRASHDEGRRSGIQESLRPHSASVQRWERLARYSHFRHCLELLLFLRRSRSSLVSKWPFGFSS